MTHTNDIKPAATHTPEPWNQGTRNIGDPRVELYDRVIHDAAGYAVAVAVEVNQPANARRIVAAVNACEGLSTEALGRGIVAKQRQSLARLADAARDLDAAIDGATGQFDDERAVLERASRLARAAVTQALVADGAAPAEIDIHELLAVRGQVALIWSVDDVQEIRPDLTARQAWDVLKQVQDKHDASLGVTWETLEWAARDLFGLAPETDEA